MFWSYRRSRRNKKNYQQYHKLDFTQNPKRAIGVSTLGRYNVLQTLEGFSLSAFAPDI